MNRRLMVLLALLPAAVSCRSSTPGATDARALFDPDSMQIHRVFTDITDWTGDAKPDGIEAIVELRDSFGDPTKGLGTFVFELHAYTPDSPDPRGTRLVEPWVARVDDAATQRRRWSRTARAYTFLLALPRIDPEGTYVLSASFAPIDGERLFDQTVVGRAPN